MLPPSCSPMRVEATCPPVCRQASWTVSLAVTDRGRSGLAALQLSEGSGTLTLLPEQAGRPWQQQEKGRDPKWEGRQGSEELNLLQGDPPLNLTGRGGGSPVCVRYTASCCAHQAELIAWDGAGNFRRCHLTSSQQGATHKPINGGGRARVALLTLLSCLLGARLVWNY